MNWKSDLLPPSFWARAKQDGDDWLWTGELWGNGYGRIKIKGITWRIHRLVWMLHHGVKPTLNILHTCDIRHCFYPDHLYQGTQADNANDMIARGRVARGEKNAATPLTSDDVHTIRKMYASGKHLQREIAAQFGVNQTAVSHIITRRTWQHI